MARKIIVIVSKNCEHCGKPMTGPVWKRFCSGACKQAAYRIRRDKKRGG